MSLKVIFLLLAFTIFCYKAHGACDGAWKTGTMSGYDNLDGQDDRHPGSLAEYEGTNSNFLTNVPVVSILDKDWPRYKYRNIEIQYKGQTKTVQSWDMCSDDDCGDDDPNCCSRNAKKYANPGFLLDVEKRALRKLFNLNWENTLTKVQYRICDRFNPAPVASRYGLSQS